MPNPGSFIGSRGEFLKDQRERYAQAVKDGNINDVVTDIQRRYFKRYPITLAHDKEPSQEWLDQVDDDAPDPEIDLPNVDGTSPENASNILQAHAELMKKIKDRKESIKRRLHYMYSKERDPRPSMKSGIAGDIVAALTSKILGVDSKIPRQKTAYNLWGPQHREVVDPVFNKRVEDGDVPTNQHIALRSAIYKELFDKLPKDEQDLWARAAVREHEKTVREIKKNLEKGASTTPQDRQRVITALPAILEPIFDLLAEHTGWRFSGIAGGPEPADGGRLNMIMIHSGVIPGTIKADFGRDQHGAFKKCITPSFGSYLKKCYSIDECRSRALPEGFDIRSLADVDAEEALDLHSFEIDKEHVEASKSHKAKRLLGKDVNPKSRKSQKRELSKRESPKPSVTPQPLRFGPPIGKKKLRELPSNDKPKTSVPLTSGAIAASAINGAVIAPLPASSSDLDEDIFGQGSRVEDLGDVPEKRILLAEEGAELNESVAAALQSYVSTMTQADPLTPAPSRDPVSIQPPPPSVSASVAPPPAASHAPPPRPSHVASRPASDPPSQPASHPPSRPASPPPSRPASHPPSRPASRVPSRPVSCAPSRPVSCAPSQHASHVSSPPASRVPSPPASRMPSPPASRAPSPPASRVPSPPAARAPSLPAYHTPSTPMPHTVSPLPVFPPAGPPTLHADVVTPARRPPSPPRHRTPSGAATVPEFPPTDAKSSNLKKASTRKGSGGSEKRKALGQNDDGPKKKQRTTSGGSTSVSFTPAFPFNLPSTCPDWVRKALDLLTRQDLGSTWRDLVAVWVRFEEQSGFSDDGERLRSQGRPILVANWIKRARSPQYAPDIENIGVYEIGFVKWWNAIQPEWRKAGVEIEVGGWRDGDDWSCLEGCYGVNGLLSVLAALFFWGSAASSEDEKLAWSNAAADAVYVLEQLV